MKLAEQNLLFLTRTMQLGGTENVVLQLCDILQPVVKKIIVCSCGGINTEALKERGIKHYLIPDIAEKSPFTMLYTYNKIKKIINKENITIIHSHHRMAAFYAELIASSNIIKIANVHNTFSDKKLLTRIAYKNTKLIAVGERVKQNLVEYFHISEVQITVIHNGIRAFSGNIQPIKILESEKKAGHILIGNIGRLSEQKGMQYFIEAAFLAVSLHPEARFFIVGDGEEKKVLQDLVDSKRLNDKIFFLGYRSDIQNIMSQLDFIVLSSLWEGLPLTPIEAYSVGKTVIGTSVDGTPEIIRDKVDGYLVEPKNSKDLAEKMIYLIEHPKIRQALERKALERYNEEFSFEKLTNKYIQYYKEL